MTEINADAIITLVSAIPALLIASLTAWLAYRTLRCQNISRDDPERGMIESSDLSRSSVSSRQTSRSNLWLPMSNSHSPEAPASSSQTSTTLLPSCENLPQLQSPPTALLRSGSQDEPDIRRIPSCQMV